MRRAAVALAAIAASLFFIWGLGRAWDVELATGSPPGETIVLRDGHSRTFGDGMVAFDERGPEAWRYRWVLERRKSEDLQRRLTARVLQVRSLKRTLAHDSSVTEALNLAAVVYGHGATLWRKAQCESHLNPNAKNRKSTAAGLLQFLDSTWASTPFAGFSVYSPYANALAGGWMHANNRGNEWVCQ